jgi:hypothetical protein
MNNIISPFSTTIQYTIKYLSTPEISYEKLGKEHGISKQAVQKHVQKGVEYLKGHGKEPNIFPENEQVFKEIQRLSELVIKLKKRIIILGIECKSLARFKEKVLSIFPNFNPGRPDADLKKFILDMCAKFQKIGGTIQEFCNAAQQSSQTIYDWKKRYDAEGINGLINKRTRPKNFGNKVPAWIKKQLLLLFIRFPQWSEYDYHKYIRHNPTINWYISIPTIAKMKSMHRKTSEYEKERARKRWCFAAGTDAWTIDFTVICKTDKYKLQLLTVSDTRSRFLFKTSLFLETSTEIVTRYLEDLFQQYGKPTLIKADNGPEFRMDCKNNLIEFSVYLLNSPFYYGQFCGAHERLHRIIKNFISNFADHKNITRLTEEITACEEEYNYNIPHESLDGKTPSEIFFNDKTFISKNPDLEIIQPYIKENDLRMKFVNRNGNPARISLPVILPHQEIPKPEVEK